MHNLFNVIASSSCNGVDTLLINCSSGGGISSIVKLVLNILFAGIAILATAGIIFVGVRYLTARDDEQQVAMAKRRILQITIGLVTASLIWVVVPLFLPGVDESTIDSTLSDLDDSTKFSGPTKPEPIATPTQPPTSGGGQQPQPETPPSTTPTAPTVSDAVWNNGNECSGAKIFPGKKYALTDEEISYFSELVARENCRSTSKDGAVVLGCKLLATQIINLYEEREYNRGGKEGCTSGSCYYKNMKKWVTSDKWYHANKNHDLRPGQYSNSNSRDAVVDVIVNGNRVMPKFVSRYDGLYHWTEHRSGFINLKTIAEAEKAVPMKTQVKSGGRYLWCIERKKTSNKNNGPYNEVFNYADSYKKALGM